MTTAQIRWRVVRFSWKVVDLFCGRLRRRTCHHCGKRHWNGDDVALPLCFECFGEWYRDYHA